MLRRLLTSSRYVVVPAVLGSFLAAAVLILYGLAAVVETAVAGVWRADVSLAHAKSLSVEMIELIDIFLLGTILYIVALGLYELFIDATLPVPAWLQIDTLDDLKDKLVGVVVVLLAVTFLGRAVVWNGSGQILQLGAAIALVIAALALPRWQRTKDGKPGVAPGADSGRDAG